MWALAGVAQLVGVCPVAEGLQVGLSVRAVPELQAQSRHQGIHGMCMQEAANVCLSLVSCFCLLRAMKICPQVRIKRKVLWYPGWDLGTEKGH